MKRSLGRSLKSRQAGMGTIDAVELSPMDFETKEVHVVPAESGLEDIVHAAEGGAGAHEEAAPDDGGDPP